MQSLFFEFLGHLCHSIINLWNKIDCVIRRNLFMIRWNIVPLVFHLYQLVWGNLTQFYRNVRFRCRLLFPRGITIFLLICFSLPSDVHWIRGGGVWSHRRPRQPMPHAGHGVIGKKFCKSNKLWKVKKVSLLPTKTCSKTLQIPSSKVASEKIKKETDPNFCNI